MCRQFLWHLGEDHKAVRAIMAEIQRKFPEEPLYELAYPSANIAYLVVSKEGKTTAAIGRWGFQAFRGAPVYNARQETVLSKGMFRGCFEGGRCIVPAHGFFEWDEEHRKFLFLPKTQTLLYFAALCRSRESIMEITVLTTHSQGEIAGVHHRMPLILKEDQLRPWLYNRQAAVELLSRGSSALRVVLAENE